MARVALRIAGCGEVARYAPFICICYGDGVSCAAG